MVAGGGTGGHVTPALALCDAVRERHSGARLWYVGRRDAFEQSMAVQAGIGFLSVCAAPLAHGFIGTLRCAGATLWGILQSVVLIMRYRPCALIGFGGYASFPLLTAGLLLRRCVVVHEANAIPGKAFRLLSRLGARCAYGLVMNRAADRRHCYTGNPLRLAFLTALAGGETELEGLRADAPTVMILGGSQGARYLNTLAPQLLRRVVEHVPALQVIHVAGRGDTETVRREYDRLGIPHHTVEFSHTIGVFYRRADVVVARAGALTVSEVCAAGDAAIFVPYPYATDDHQYWNARVVADREGAYVVRQDELEPERVSALLTALLRDDELRLAMQERAHALACPDAAFRLLTFTEQCAGLQAA